MGADGPILVLNAGSSSLKYASFERPSLALIAAGQVAGIGRSATSPPDHRAALDQVLATQAKVAGPPSAVGLRVVHGGARTGAAILTPEVLHDIEQAAQLAPLHNPPALDVIRALDPALPQVVAFDTAFHAQNPPEATSFALPESFREKGIRRYGFHGLSYAGLVRRFTGLTDQPLPRRLLALHLGAGASMAAILDGVGVATTMGFSPLDGLVMATRGGSLDPGVILHLARAEGLDIAQIDTLLNHQSGLLALAGSADMKAVLASDTAACRFAIRHYCYWLNRHAGSMVAAMGGLDGVVFTGGIGENATPIRKRFMAGLAWAGPVPHWVIKADEEAEIARLTAALL